MFCRRKSFDTFYQYSLFVLFHLSEFSDWSKSRVYYLFEWIRSIGLQHAGISLKNCAMSLICRWARGRLRSSTSSPLDVRPSRRATVADRSFATTACPRIWNGLPDDVTSATPLLTCREKLKAHLFRQSYPDIILCLSLVFATVLLITQSTINSLQ